MPKFFARGGVHTQHMAGSGVGVAAGDEHLVAQTTGEECPTPGSSIFQF